MEIKTILKEGLGRAVALILTPIIALAVGIILLLLKFG